MLLSARRMCRFLAAVGFIFANLALGHPSSCHGQSCLVEGDQTAMLQSSLLHRGETLDMAEASRRRNRKGRGKGKGGKGEAMEPMPVIPDDFGDIIPGSQVVAPVSTQYVSQNLSLVPRGSGCYNSTLATLQQHPGKKLFGDQGYTQNAWGGIFTYNVFRAQVPTTLYALRQNITKDPYAYVSQWFSTSLYNPNNSQPLTWAEYSNSIAATCWNYTVAIKCTFKKETSFVVGSGGWRDTSIENMCHFPPGTGPHQQKIITPQTPAPSIMQWIVDPKGSQAECVVCPVDYTNLPASFDKGCEPVDFGLEPPANSVYRSERDYVPR